LVNIFRLARSGHYMRFCKSKEGFRKNLIEVTTVLTEGKGEAKGMGKLDDYTNTRLQL
jgi:hypothetical protein